MSGRWALHERLSASASLRQDWLEFEVDDSFFTDGNDSGSRRFEESSPMLGLSWELTRGLALFVNAATSFETPTSTELANPIGGGFNADLKSQTATNFEVGLKGARFIHERSLRYELTAFHIDIDDALVPFEPVNLSGRDFFRNAGKSERIGIEAVVQFELFKNLQIDLSYTWSDFKYKEFDVSGADFGGNRLPGIPEHFGNLQINYQPEEDGFFVRWNTRFNGSSYANDANTAKVDSYLISDLRIGFERVWGAWTIEPFIGINNVFDQTYNANIRINASRSRYYEPAPERNIYSGIRIRYGFD